MVKARTHDHNGNKGIKYAKICYPRKRLSNCS
jgi:hypothetical protein